MRALFPVTYLVDPYAVYNINVGGRIHALRLSDIPDIPNKKRKLVLKYSGMDPDLRAGARGVFNLTFCNAEETGKLLQRALDDVYRGEPWLLQEMVNEQFRFTYLSKQGEIVTDNLCARINPYYAFPITGGSELMGSLIYFRDFWKVHGGCDTVETIMAVTPPSS